VYENHFRLQSKPFSLSPDPRFLYFGKRHSQAYAMLQYGIREQVGFAVVTGEVGAGKTTLLRKVIEEFDGTNNLAVVSHTHKNLTDVIPTVMDAFGVGVDDSGEDPALMYRTFVDFLVSQYAKGRRSILMIDEAQNLSVDALEQLRLLSNVNVDGHLLLQTLLVGQPELKEKLACPELKQFAQRISVDFFLPKLSWNESLAYIDHRIEVAGGAPDIFERKAKSLISHAAQGLPRMINNLCDMSLVYAFGDGKKVVEMSVVIDVIKDKEQSGILPLVPLSELRHKLATAS
jgi:general secretion pathway protein A